MGTTRVYKQEDMAPTGRGQWSPMCTHMATSEDNEADYKERTQAGLERKELMDTEEVCEQWLPACTHMAISDDDGQLLASGARAHTHTHTRNHIRYRGS